jgi:hypothetical protein
MKKIITPKQLEKAEYICDFTGKSFNDFTAPVEVTFEFNYGSKYDSTRFTLHLDDESVEKILQIVKENIKEESKQYINQNTLAKFTDLFKM